MNANMAGDLRDFPADDVPESLPTGWSQQMWDETQRSNELASELISQGVAPLAAIVRANDMVSAERATRMVAEGKWSLRQAVYRVGSFTRFAWAVENMPQRWWYEADNLVDLWRGSDPDDTNPDFVRLFQQVQFAKNVAYLRDGKALPRNSILRIYRGQIEGDPLGMAWSLSRHVATAFAGGMGARVAMEGVVYEAACWRTSVLAYITQRHEEEIVIDPTDVMGAKIVQKVEVRRND